MLIARDVELAELQAVLNESAYGCGRTVLLEGPVGCGKTEVLQAVAKRAQDTGAVVLRAVGMPSEAGVPLGVMRQLVCGDTFSADDSAELRRLLDEAVQADTQPAAGVVAIGRTVRMQEFWSALQNAANGRLTVIAVDDLHHADCASVQYLLHIAERSRSAKLLMVLTEALHYRQQDTDYRTELLRQATFRILVECLDRRAVTELLIRDRRERRSGAVEVDEFFEVTRGNPLLVRALAEERRTAASERAVAVDGLDQAGDDTFTRAVLACLNRSGPVATTIAEGLAVLGTSASPTLLSRLCDLPRAAVAQGLRALLASGIVDECHLKHEAVSSRILDELGPARLQDLHRRAAVLLHEDGAAASAVARHLRALDRVDEPWATAVLRDAAEEALAADDDGLAVTCLDLAQRWCDDSCLRAEIKIRAALLRRRNHPAAAEQTAEELLAEVRAGEVPARYAPAVARLFLAWHRLDDAQEVLALGCAAGGSHCGEDVGQPERSGPHGGDAGTGPDADLELAGLVTWFRLEPDGAGNAVPWSPLSPSAGGDVATAAEDLLDRSVLTDATVETITRAVRCLLSLGRTDRAQYWTDLFLHESARRGAGGWQALFAGLGAEADLAQGNAAGAEGLAEEGLARLGRGAKSGLSYGLIAPQVLAQTVMGKYEAVARRLNEPVLGELYGSVPGLTYVRARGRYSLATGRLAAAMNDFLAVARTAQRWRIDPPMWLPWRGDLAEVLLRAGEAGEAERLLRAQIAGLDGADARGLGISLRLLAGAVGPGDRLPLLTQAVAKLQLAGDRLELAHALCDLGRTYHELREPAPARTAYRQAGELATACCAQPLQARIRLEYTEATWEAEVDRVPADARDARLSDSEKRVAALAACGYTNRHISSHLFITVSTVEQHLTRAYRKLRIEGRQQLPVDLQFEVPAAGRDGGLPGSPAATGAPTGGASGWTPSRPASRAGRRQDGEPGGQSARAPDGGRRPGFLHGTPPHDLQRLERRPASWRKVLPTIPPLIASIPTATTTIGRAITSRVRYSGRTMPRAPAPVTNSSRRATGAGGEEDAEWVHGVGRVQQRLNLPVLAAVGACVNVAQVHRSSQTPDARREVGLGSGAAPPVSTTVGGTTSA